MAENAGFVERTRRVRQRLRCQAHRFLHREVTAYVRCATLGRARKVAVQKIHSNLRTGEKDCLFLEMSEVPYSKDRENMRVTSLSKEMTRSVVPSALVPR